MNSTPRLIKPETPQRETRTSLPAKPTGKSKHPHVWNKLLGKRIVIQEKGGTILTGLFDLYAEGFFKLKDATIIGHNQTVTVPRVWVDRGAVAHFHEEAAD